MFFQVPPIFVRIGSNKELNGFLFPKIKSEMINPDSVPQVNPSPENPEAKYKFFVVGTNPKEKKKNQLFSFIFLFSFYFIYQ